MIKQYDEDTLSEAVRAAELAGIEQVRFLNAAEESATSNESSSDGEEGGLINGKTRGKRGGLDLDVWQGGERLKRRGWTPKKSVEEV